MSIKLRTACSWRGRHMVYAEQAKESSMVLEGHA